MSNYLIAMATFAGIYGLMALAFLGSHFFGKVLMVKRLLGHVFALPAPLWTRLNLCWVLFFLVQAGANTLVAALFSEAIWVSFKTFGDVVIMLVFLGGQFFYLQEYVVIGEPKEAGTDVSDTADSS